MLIDFELENYRSFRATQTLSLIADNAGKEHPNCLISLELPRGAELMLLRGVAIYGANASGKSNLIKGLLFLREWVLHSATREQPEGLERPMPFQLDSDWVTRPTRMSLSFLHEGIRYRFCVCLDATRIYEESLTAYPKGAAQKWYQRRFEPSRQSCDWSFSVHFKQGEGLSRKTRENALLLSVGAQLNHPQLAPVCQWFERGLRHVRLLGENGMRLSPLQTIAKLKENPRDGRILGLLRAADERICGASLYHETVDLNQYRAHFAPKLINHLSDRAQQAFELSGARLCRQLAGGETVQFNLEEESAGTQRLFALAGYWADLLDEGHTLLLDELDCGLHPLLVPKLLEGVFSPESNPKGGQLLFTTHNSRLLDQDLLRRDQIWFTEKDEVGATRLYPLTNFSPRKDESLGKGYLTGRYGAIPRVSGEVHDPL